jgi:hypothetical protein
MCTKIAAEARYYIGNCERVMKLHFYGPYPLCSTEHDVLDGCQYAGSGGIYVWVVPTENHGLLVDYIGETGKSFYERTKEHIIRSLGGDYEILEPSEMIRGKATVVWRGLWRRGTRDQLPQFLSRYETLAPIIKSYLLNHLIFVAPIDCEVRLRRRVEGALATAVSAATHHLVPEDIRYVTRRPNERPVDVTITCDHRIVGLPARLLA